MSGRDPFKSAFDRMMSMVEEHQVEMLSRSYCLAMRPERKARLRAIIELSVELEKIRAVSIQATGMHESIIESIIEGDWKRAAETDRLTLAEPKSYHPEQAEVYRKLWENFRTILMAAVAEAARRESGQTTEPD